MRKLNIAIHRAFIVRWKRGVASIIRNRSSMFDKNVCRDVDRVPGADVFVFDIAFLGGSVCVVIREIISKVVSFISVRESITNTRKIVKLFSIFFFLLYRSRENTSRRYYLAVIDLLISMHG